MSKHKLSRRHALESIGTFIAGSIVSSRFATRQVPSTRIASLTEPALAPRDELVNKVEVLAYLE